MTANAAESEPEALQAELEALQAELNALRAEIADRDRHIQQMEAEIPNACLTS